MIHVRCRYKRAYWSSLILAATFLTGMDSATAVDPMPKGFHGYMRWGTGSNKGEGGGQACFGLQGVAKYRLGNECDFNAEVGYGSELVKFSNGASLGGFAMVNAVTPSPHPSDSTVRIIQAYLETKGLASLRGGTAWIGRRYYNRPDIHVIDFKYVVMDGEGLGVDGIALGPGKFSYALFRNDVNLTKSATRHNFIYQDLPANTNGTLKIDATIIHADDAPANVERHGGWSLSLIHKQSKFLGGDNTLALQYGVGSAIKIGGTGDLSLGSDYHRTRIADQLIWQFTPRLIGSADVLVQRDHTPNGTQTWTSIGTRPIYIVSEHIKMQLDIGHDRIIPADGSPIQKLSKVTFAPTLTSGKNFFDRPELRLFITYARWNDAAQAAASPDSALSRTGVFGGSTSGVSYGLHFEHWF